MEYPEWQNRIEEARMLRETCQQCLEDGKQTIGENGQASEPYRPLFLDGLPQQAAPGYRNPRRRRRQVLDQFLVVPSRTDRATVIDEKGGATALSSGIIYLPKETGSCLRSFPQNKIFSHSSTHAIKKSKNGKTSPKGRPQLCLVPILRSDKT